ncbi:response regulator [Parafrankia elaeagni]|uniref:response regulator n=1 Tax=Parafrankia elaeagni TaxID=222534 RepID=UPI000374C1C5|nr:response regulator transcription factor [Parafrankia elaeagni]
MRPRLLLVDDDDAIRDMVGTALRYAGFETTVAVDGRDALARLAEMTPDLIVLDVLMPGLDGLEVCRRLRGRGETTPIIFLTARASSRDVLEGFGRGGDDYVTKPFVLDELVARIRAVLHRAGSSTSGTSLTCADLVLHEERHEVRRAGQRIELSPTEFSLLRYLMTNQGRVLSKHQILDRVWNQDLDGDGHVVETYISTLRRRLDVGGDGPLIHTIRGVGYTLRPAGE